MGFLNFLKGKEEPVTFPAMLGAAAKGQFVPMKEIHDEVFSSGVLGKCCGIDPEYGKVFAPISGTVGHVADTAHAIGLEAGGMELLLHIGIYTVDMNGNGFQVAVKAGQAVKKGDLLLTMDLEKIRSAGHPATVILVLTNTDDFASVEDMASGIVQVGDAVMRVGK